MRARWGRRPRGEGRVQSPAGRGALSLRRMRRERAQSRTRLSATGWREETPDGESAKEIWPPPSARAPVKERHKKKLLQPLLILLRRRSPKSQERILMVSHTKEGLESVDLETPF